MKNLDIEKTEHAKSIQEVLKQGARSDFWDVMCQRIQKAIDGLQTSLDSDEFQALPADEYKIKIEILKNEKRNLIGILDMPEVLASELDKPEFFDREKEQEIYATGEELVDNAQ